MFFFFGVTLGTLMLAHRLAVPIQTKLGLLGAQIGKDPPWYFIHQDFAEGVSSTIALLIAWTLALIFWRRFPLYTPMCIWMPWMSLAGKIAKAVIIYRECPGLLDGGAATTSWQTFDSYLKSPDISYYEATVRWTGGGLALVLAIAQGVRTRQKSLN